MVLPVTVTFPPVSLSPKTSFSIVTFKVYCSVAVCVFAALPLISYVSATTATKLRPIWFAVQTQQGAYSAVLQESIAGIRVVQAFTAEEREYENFQKANWNVRESSLDANRVALWGCSEADARS